MQPEQFIAAKRPHIHWMDWARTMAIWAIATSHALDMCDMSTGWSESEPAYGAFKKAYNLNAQ